jgi:hypothetical protein
MSQIHVPKLIIIKNPSSSSLMSTKRSTNNSNDDNNTNWIPALPDIPMNKMKLRRLHVEENSKRFALELWLAPNVTYPSHIHGSAEWCWIAKGSLVDQWGEKKQGDFFYNESQSPHYNIRSGSQGVTIYVVKDVGNNMPAPHLDNQQNTSMSSSSSSSSSIIDDDTTTAISISSSKSSRKKNSTTTTKKQATNSANNNKKLNLVDIITIDKKTKNNRNNNNNKRRRIA